MQWLSASKASESRSEDSREINAIFAINKLIIHLIIHLLFINKLLRNIQILNVDLFQIKVDHMATHIASHFLDYKLLSQSVSGMQTCQVQIVNVPKFSVNKTAS